MTVSDICIKRPVFTWVLMMIPVVLGSLSYLELGVDLFPNVDFPVCAVVTTLPNASVEEIESTVTKPIEDVINQISGIDELRSQSLEGTSIVTVQFDLSKPLDVGVQEVRDKVGIVVNQLPEGTETPVVSRFSTDEIPIMTIAVSGRRDLREVTEIARRQIKERLETVSGVGTVGLSGGKVRAMNIVIDADKLDAYGLSIEEVRQALARQNVETPGGRIDQGERELVLRTLGRLETEQEFNNLIVVNRGGYPVKIRDLGHAEDSNEEVRTLARLEVFENGISQGAKNAVSLTIQKQAGSNVVAVADEIFKRLEKIKASLPDDIEIAITRDQSRFVRKSIEEVQFHMLLAAILVSGTIYLFIRDWRTTVIASLAVPTSIIPTFAFMYVMGFTLNNITILGLILAIGIVIDDAIVVHENIFRHMEEHGLDGYEAARMGTREIALPVMATSLSLIVIFLPIGFMGGIIGKFFSSFGLTVAFAVAMSLFVSFTLTPMLCSRFLKLDSSQGAGGPQKAKSKSGLIYRLVDGTYGLILRFALRFKFLVVLMTLVVVIATYPLALGVGFNLIPRDDQSEFEVVFTTPEGYTLKRTDEVTAEIEARLREQIRDMKYMYTSIGNAVSGGIASSEGDVTKSSIYIRLKDLEERSPGVTQFNQQEIARKILLDYPELRSSVNDVSPFQGGSRGQTFQVNLAGPDLEKLEELARQLADKLAATGNVTDLDTSLTLRKPELQVRVDREAASDLGVQVGVVADSLRALVGGIKVSKFRDGPEQYDVWLRATKIDRQDERALLRLTIPSTMMGLVRLESLAELEFELGPTEIERYNRERIVTVLANPKQGMALGELVKLTTSLLDPNSTNPDRLELPPGYSFRFTGQAETLAELFRYFAIAFFLSVTFMYLILAAQFESWSQPVAILMSLPVTVPFGLLSMILFQTPMDLYAMFGLFMLVGIVKKNGILQIDATNQFRAAGMNRRQAILEANHTRLRPILMTTFMLVAAMIPLALGQGPGSGSRASMAKVIIGGQVLSLVLALVVTPVFYVYLDQLRNLMRKSPFRLTVERQTHSLNASDQPARPVPVMARVFESSHSLPHDNGHGYGNGHGLRSPVEPSEPYERPVGSSAAKSSAD